MTKLVRRGFNLGAAKSSTVGTSIHDTKPPFDCWRQGLPVFLPQQCADQLNEHAHHIGQSAALAAAAINAENIDEQLAQPPYAERVDPHFQSLGSAYNEGDDQEIEMVMFDAIDGDKVVAEDLWFKASWLSFHDEDASLRFRFSFGVDLEEDVAADPQRQKLAAQLTDAVFPESAIITDNPELRSTLTQLLDGQPPSFVERIIYFNAPNGGAYLHHDLERGHAGVVFAQLSGKTFWLALPKNHLIEEIIAFSKSHPWPASLTLAMRQEMSDLLCDRELLATELDSFGNHSLIHLINETEEFVQFLIARGHSQTLSPGDVLLLPQATAQSCCWHSVFSLSNEIGQALSFAVRPDG